MKFFAVLALSNIAIATFTCYQCESDDQHGPCAKGKDMQTKSDCGANNPGGCSTSVHWQRYLNGTERYHIKRGCGLAVVGNPSGWPQQSHSDDKYDQKYYECHNDLCNKTSGAKILNFSFLSAIISVISGIYLVR